METKFRPAVTFHSTDSPDQFIQSLYDTGCIQTGEFRLSSGLNSPLYIDLRRVPSYPLLYEQLVTTMSTVADLIPCDLVCGVPMASLPFASVIALCTQLPLIMPRSEQKSHGTGKLIEGVFDPGQTVLVVEDLVTSGKSTLKTVRRLREAGLVVTDVLTVIDREQGGVSRIEQEEISVHALFTLSDILSELHECGKINETTKAAITHYIQTHQFSE